MQRVHLTPKAQTILARIHKELIDDSGWESEEGLNFASYYQHGFNELEGNNSAKSDFFEYCLLYDCGKLADFKQVRKFINIAYYYCNPFQLDIIFRHKDEVNYPLFKKSAVENEIKRIQEALDATHRMPAVEGVRYLMVSEDIDPGFVCHLNTSRCIESLIKNPIFATNWLIKNWEQYEIDDATLKNLCEYFQQEIQQFIDLEKGISNKYIKKLQDNLNDVSFCHQAKSEFALAVNEIIQSFNFENLTTANQKSIARAHEGSELFRQAQKLLSTKIVSKGEIKESLCGLRYLYYLINKYDGSTTTQIKAIIEEARLKAGVMFLLHKQFFPALVLLYYAEKPTMNLHLAELLISQAEHIYDCAFYDTTKRRMFSKIILPDLSKHLLADIDHNTLMTFDNGEEQRIGDIKDASNELVMKACAVDQQSLIQGYIKKLIDYGNKTYALESQTNSSNSSSAIFNHFSNSSNSSSNNSLADASFNPTKDQETEDEELIDLTANTELQKILAYYFQIEEFTMKLDINGMTMVHNISETGKEKDKAFHEDIRQKINGIDIKIRNKKYIITLSDHEEIKNYLESFKIPAKVVYLKNRVDFELTSKRKCILM